MHPFELAEAGALYGRNDRIFRLRAGLYVYLVTSDRDVILAPKFHIKKLFKTGRGLATHKSLLRRSMKTLGRKPEIVAAGQLTYFFGQIVRIDNRSGNFRGDINALRFAAGILVSLGLEINPSAVIVAFDPEDPQQNGHTPEELTLDEYQMEIQVQVAGDPLGRRLINFYDSLGRVLIDAAADRRLDTGLKIMLDATNTNYLADFIQIAYPLESARSADGLAFGVLRVALERDGVAFVQTAKEMVETLSGSDNSQLLPRHRHQLRRLAESL